VKNPPNTKPEYCAVHKKSAQNETDINAQTILNPRAVTGFIDVKLQNWCAIYSKIRILFRIQFAHRSQLMRSNSQEASQ